ncbi:MAG: hypothetical protein H8E21_05795 [Gammaproteobacteria bacterium]|nr:hypothetical protein [Gammaproteobacteria bacterium]MBL7000395.1 hypothetical protein [Gammaproteobacteria bacterium]
MLLSLGCQTMREGVTSSLIFFIAGILMILVAMHVVPQIWNLNHIVMLFGFILLLLSPLILISTFLISVLPKSRQKMDQCDH